MLSKEKIMATVIRTQMVDDLDGTTSADVSTVSFALDGVTYEMELTASNREKLFDSLAGFVLAARTVGGRGRVFSAPPRTFVRPRVDREQNQAIRDWARASGRRVADRGRIPATILEDFEKAHRPTKRVAAATSSPTPTEPGATAPRRHRREVARRR
jgi:Lsr2